MSCIEPSEETTETLRMLAAGVNRVDLLPVAGVEQLGRLQWVIGGAVVELTGIGHYHAGTATGGLLGG